MESLRIGVLAIVLACLVFPANARPVLPVPAAADAGPPPADAAKTVANGLYMDGRYTATYGSGYSTVTVNLDRINNDSYTRTTGTLRLEYWASVTRPSRGGTFSGYRLARFSTLSPLLPRHYYSDIVRSSAMTVPPDGTYWLVLILTEYNPSGCSAADGYCMQDSFVSDAQRTFGNVPTTQTLYVTKNGTGSGTVTSSPAGISCGSTCSAAFSTGTTVSLSAMPASGSAFGGWGGSCSGTGACSVALSAAATVTATFTSTGGPPPATGGNYSDIWWNPSESGWGLTLADHETQMFGVWYTYRPDGAPIWYVFPGGTFSENRRFFTADLYATTGPTYAGTFDPDRVTRTLVGSVSLDFAPPGLPAGTALFTFTIGNVTQTKRIQRQAFGNAPPNWGTDYTDIWWNANESGWGLTLAHHGNDVFGVWYTYGADGEPLFIVLPGVTFTSATSFTGTLYTTRGPWYGNATFNPALVELFVVGTATISFSGRTLTFRSTVNGFTQTKTAVQQSFGRTRPGIQFTAGAAPPARVGQSYRHCYCQPAPTNANDLCGANSTNPSGGSGPYYFTLGTAGGFPPMGIILGLNGCLTGTASQQGTSSFTVCATDLGGNTSCSATSVAVQPQTQASGLSGTWRGNWNQRFGGFGDGVWDLTWTLTTSGTAVTGTFTKRLTSCDGLCPDNVGYTESGNLVNGSLSGSSFTIFTQGGTSFSGTLSGNTLSGTSGGSFPGTFSLTRQ